MTVDELLSILEALNKRSREQWEMMRVQTFHLIQPHISSKSISKLTPQKLIPYPWDKEQDKILPKEDKQSILKRLEKAKSTNKVAKI